MTFLVTVTSGFDFRLEAKVTLRRRLKNHGVCYTCPQMHMNALDESPHIESNTYVLKT